MTTLDYFLVIGILMIIVFLGYLKSKKETRTSQIIFFTDFLIGGALIEIYYINFLFSLL
jgi:hypothetical protein